MRDLYKRLGVDQSASEATIATAIDGCKNNALQADAAAVLGVAARREAYDELYATLSDLGRLRGRLGLTHGAHWQDSVANDFSLAPDLARSRHDQLIAKLDDAVASQLRLQRWQHRWPWLITAALSVVTLAVAAGAVFL